MEDFRHTNRLVAGFHVTKPSAIITYASAALRGTVHIALTVAALNNFQVKTADTQKSYIQVPVAEKIWTVLDPELGPDDGKSAVVFRALYGLKSAGASF